MLSSKKLKPKYPFEDLNQKNIKIMFKKYKSFAKYLSGINSHLAVQDAILPTLEGLIYL